MTATVIDFPNSRRVERVVPDGRLLARTEKLATMVRSGEVVGLYAAVVYADGGVATVFDEPPGKLAPFQALGALDWLKSRIRSKHDL